jgi:hypothetical protein
LVIGKAGLVVTADNKTRIYGDANPSLTYTVTGFVNSETSSVLSGSPTIATTAGLTSNVGTVAITAAANNLTASNYSFTYANGSLTITPAALTVTGANTSVTYSGVAQTNSAATVSGLKNSDSFTIAGYGTGTNYNAAAYTDTLAATPVSGTLASNYSISYTHGGLSIGKAGLLVTADNKTRIYGDANPALTYTVTGFVNSETSAVISGAPTIATTADLTSNVGNVAITALANNLAANNYNLATRLRH